MPIIEGAIGAPLTNAGAPSAGTSEVQTLTIGGTPTSGTFKLAFEGFTTAAITWSATNATLISNIDAALEALGSIGTGGITTAEGSLTAGIGTITLTFAGNRTKQAIGSLITVAENSLAGSSPTLAIAETTPGVDATGRGAPKGALLVDTTNGNLYINQGTALAPTWTPLAGNSGAGVAAGYKVARGESAVTGTVDIATGLATVVQAIACLETDPAIATAMWCSVADSATPGNIVLKTWKPTAADNATPIAGTGTPSVRWIAVGT